MLIFHLGFAVIFAYFFFNAAYILVYAIASLFYKSQAKDTTCINKQNKFLLLVPCYKGDSVILKTAPQSLQVDYPKEFYKLVVIADSLQPETIQQLKQYDLEVVEVSFENSSKANSLRYAVNQQTEDFDYAIILDIDNVMDRHFLAILNAKLQNGERLVQAHRTALNANNSLAILDGASEEINNSIFRTGHRVLGLSAAFIGSGKAIEYTFFKEMIQNVHSVGEDKEMELGVLQKGETIYYADDAHVFDEKVDQAENFQNQRRRWLRIQAHFFRTHLIPATKELITKGNIDYFDKMLQMVLFPRVLLIGSTFAMTLFAWLFPSLVYPHYGYWLLVFLMVALALYFAVPKKYLKNPFVKAIFHLPMAFVSMFLALFKVKGASKTFIHTQHKEDHK